MPKRCGSPDLFRQGSMVDSRWCVIGPTSAEAGRGLPGARDLRAKFRCPPPRAEAVGLWQRIPLRAMDLPLGAR
jgi:hypothetical protein